LSFVEGKSSGVIFRHPAGERYPNRKRKRACDLDDTRSRVRISWPSAAILLLPTPSYLHYLFRELAIVREKADFGALLSRCLALIADSVTDVLESITLTSPCTEYHDRALSSCILPEVSQSIRSDQLSSELLPSFARTPTISSRRPPAYPQRLPGSTISTWRRLP
jgi:hypothetical protein